MVDPAELQAKLKAMSDDYAAQLPGKLGNIEQAYAQLSGDGWNEEGFQTLHRIVHSLTGSGKTFGFSLLSDVARNLEEYLKQIVQAGAPPDEEQRKRIQVLLSELRQVAMKRDDIDQIGSIMPLKQERDRTGSGRIFLVDDEPELAESLKLQLNFFGYEVSVFDNLEDFRMAMQDGPDVVVLMDDTFPESGQGGIEAMQEIQQGRKTPLPVVFMTAKDDLETRLAAARAGGIAYLNKPVNIGSLIDKLDSLVSTEPDSPYRVLIIDDSEALTTYYAAVLEQAGMEVKAVNDPLKVMGPLVEFNPVSAK